MALGMPEEKLLIPLAHAFLKTNKVVPAAALLHKAAALGYDAPELTDDLAEIETRLSEAGKTWDVPLVTNPTSRIGTGKSGKVDDAKADGQNLVRK